MTENTAIMRSATRSASACSARRSIPDALADEGFQSFTYALLPHSGDWLTGGVLAEAEDLNQPLLCKVVDAADEVTWSAVGIEGLPSASAVLSRRRTRAHLILRTYEPAGARGTAEGDAAVGLGDCGGGQSARGITWDPAT